MPDLDAAIRAKLDARPVARNIRTDDDQARANAWMIRAQNALTAVLDLHKPGSNEAYAPGSREVRTVCDACSPGEDDYYDQPYPCPTVRAIATALGVSLTG